MSKIFYTLVITLALAFIASAAGQAISGLQRYDEIHAS